MKEDQTQLITARLEHLRFMMESGNMLIFRHRSDMFLFALEAYNIARGLSSRYYRMQEDLDIRFFVRFQFDYWLGQLQQWIETLGGEAYQVEDKYFFAEGRAKRLTIVVDKLFKYHEDCIPADSAEGSNPLPEEEILEPFKAILDMKSVDMVAAFRKALQEVHDYLLRLSMVPVVWPEEKRREALQVYLDDSLRRAEIQRELSNYKYFCGMPDGKTVKSHFCYLKQRLVELTAGGELNSLSIAKCDQDELLSKLKSFFGKEETNPTEDQIPSDARPMADDVLFAKFLYFVRLDGENSFPVQDADKVSNYLIRKDVYLSVEQERNLQSLFALMGAMNTYFAPILAARSDGSKHGAKMRERVDAVLSHVKKYNAKLPQLIAHGHTVQELDDFFDRLFSPEWREQYGDGQDELLKLFEKGLDAIKLAPYVQMLREADNTLHIFVNKTTFGKEIYNCLQGEEIVEDANGETVNTYYSKTGYKSEHNWKQAIKLVEAVEKDLTKEK